MSARYREIEITGSPLRNGRQLGEAAREEVRGFADVALERVNKTISISRNAALEVARQSAACVESYAPHMRRVTRHCTESGVSFDDLVLLQVRNQLQPEEDAGCTSFAAPSIVAQNWDNDPALDPYTIVLRRKTTEGPAIMNITQAGLIAYIGLNDAGIGVCLNTLPAPSRRIGVPHYFTVRALREHESGASGERHSTRRARYTRQYHAGNASRSGRLRSDHRRCLPAARPQIGHPYQPLSTSPISGC